MSPFIVGIYLAAGRSQRMEMNKLMLPVGDSSLGSYGLYTILNSHVNFTTIVTRPFDRLCWLDQTLRHEGDLEYIRCEKVDSGISESIKTGVRRALTIGADAAVVFLADQPFVSKTLIDKLIEAYRKQTNAYFVASSWNGRVRPPVLFSKHAFSGLLELQGDQGARERLTGSWRNKGQFVDYEDEACFFDVDTKEDYNRVKKLAVNKAYYPYNVEE
ncbi:NTP transferase domain-containing protein [Texcoconibacillus texcoconensis]|uniref:Molybdenum cofactor cytidylyltransferase n=1 Tax=Texcoconibacillus texcoconensis TaxID=1095777 RepID=A0A840QLN3_9BACI|nr:molybdenum cofactor cytidylyltransferase [Texcoconibacillus texcoconensis]